MHSTPPRARVDLPPVHPPSPHMHIAPPSERPQVVAPHVVVSSPVPPPVVVTRQPGYGYYYYEPMPRSVYMGASYVLVWSPDEYPSRLHARITEIESELRADIARGRVAPAALRELHVQRGCLDSTLAHASADGAIYDNERRELNRFVRRMDRLDRDDSALPAGTYWIVVELGVAPNDYVLTVRLADPGP